MLTEDPFYININKMFLNKNIFSNKKLSENRCIVLLIYLMQTCSMTGLISSYLLLLLSVAISCIMCFWKTLIYIMRQWGSQKLIIVLYHYENHCDLTDAMKGSWEPQRPLGCTLRTTEPGIGERVVTGWLDFRGVLGRLKRDSHLHRAAWWCRTGHAATPASVTLPRWCPRSISKDSSCSKVPCFISQSRGGAQYIPFEWVYKKWMSKECMMLLKGFLHWVENWTRI